MNGFWINPAHPPTHSSPSLVLLYKPDVKSVICGVILNPNVTRVVLAAVIM